MKRKEILLEVLIFVAITTILSIGWYYLYEIVVPNIIAKAYDGKGWGIIAKQMPNKDIVSLEKYQAAFKVKFQNMYIPIIIFGVLLIFLRKVFDKKSRLVEYVNNFNFTANHLAVIRILAVSLLLIPVLGEEIQTVSYIPLEVIKPLNVTRYLYNKGFEIITQSYEILLTFRYTLLIFVIFTIVGFKTKFSLAITIILYTFYGIILRDYSHMFHRDTLALYPLLVLVFTPCGRALSVDRLIKIIKNKSVENISVPNKIYSWSVFTCWFVVTVPYLFVGINKLRNGGLTWWYGENLKNKVLSDCLTTLEFDNSFGLLLFDAPIWVFTILALYALIVQSLYPITLFSKKARFVWPIAISLLHIGIFLMQDVLFLDAIIAPILFINVYRIKEYIQKLYKDNKVDILFDGNCPLCRRTISIIKALDYFGIIGYTNFRKLDIKQYNKKWGTSLTEKLLDEEMFINFNGKHLAGFSAYRQLLAYYPLFFIIIPFLYLPGVKQLGDFVYRKIASKRLGILKCKDDCVIDFSSYNLEQNQQNSKENKLGATLIIKRVMLGASIIGILAFTFKIYFYPVLPWKVYSGSNFSGIVTYTNLYVEKSSGKYHETNIDEIIPALKENRYMALIQPDDSTSVRNAEILLNRCAKIYNSENDEDSILSFTFVVKRWNYKKFPNDKEKGEIKFIKKFETK